MGDMKIDIIKKPLAILLILCFLLSVTAASVSAAHNNQQDNGKDAYKKGFNKGYKDGKKQAKKDCEQHGRKEVLRKISKPFFIHGWTKILQGKAMLKAILMSTSKATITRDTLV